MSLMGHWVKSTDKIDKERDYVLLKNEYLLH